MTNITLGGNVSIGVTIRDEQTREIIDDRVVTIDAIRDTEGYNYSTATGTVAITNLGIGTYELRYNAEGYHPRSYFINAINGSNEVDLYLLNDSVDVSDRIILTLADQSGSPASNIAVHLQRNYVINGSAQFITVSMSRTNFEGQAVLYAEMYDVWYRMIYTNADSSVIYKITDPSPFLSTVPTDTVNLLEDTYLSWRYYDNVIGNVTFLNDTGTIYARFIYLDTNNLVRRGCLDVKRISAADGITQVCLNCTNAASATLTCIVDHTLLGQYRATGLIETNTTNSWYVLDSFFYDLPTPAKFAQEGIFMSVIAIGTLTMMGIGTVTGSLLFMMVGLIGLVVMQMIVGFTIGYLWWIAVLIMIIIFMIRRSKQ